MDQAFLSQIFFTLTPKYIVGTKDYQRGKKKKNLNVFVDIG